MIFSDACLPCDSGSSTVTSRLPGGRWSRITGQYCVDDTGNSNNDSIRILLVLSSADEYLDLELPIFNNILFLAFCDNDIETVNKFASYLTA